MSTMTVADVRPFQHSSPTGGFVTSDSLPAAQLEVGMVFRDAGEWVPIAQVRQLGDVITELIVFAERGRQVRRLLSSNSVEVRRDMRWVASKVAACGCWETLDGKWRCVKHLRAS